MPLDKLQRKVATIALKAGRRYGLALGGAGALIEHGIVHRPTQDLDLVTNRETGVAAAAGQCRPHCTTPDCASSGAGIPR